MLFSESGQPLPPSDILARLRRVDANLGLLWLPDFASRDVRIDAKGQWAITYTWSPADLRYQFIQQGEWDPSKDFDILCFLPPDCPVEDAMGYFARGVQSSDNADVRKLCERSHEVREAQRQAMWQPIIDEAIAHLDQHVIREHIPFSAGGL